MTGRLATPVAVLAVLGLTLAGLTGAVLENRLNTERCCTGDPDRPLACDYTEDGQPNAVRCPLNEGSGP